MYQYSRPHITPRSGYVYTDPDTGVKFEEPVHVKLVETVARHRRANRLPIPEDLSEIVEDAVCRLNPPAFRKPRPALGSALPHSPRTPRPGRVRLSLASCVNETLKIVKRRFIPAPDRDEVARRADICLACENNVIEPGCYGCYAEKVFSGHIGKHRTMKTQFVCLCEVDNTFSKATTHMNAVYEDADRYPQECWKRG